MSEALCNIPLHGFLYYGGDMLAPRRTHKLDDRPLSSVPDCLSIRFAATLQIWRSCLHGNLRTRHAMATRQLSMAHMKVRVENRLITYELLSWITYNMGIKKTLKQRKSPGNEIMWSIMQKLHARVTYAEKLYNAVWQHVIPATRIS